MNCKRCQERPAAICARCADEISDAGPTFKQIAAALGALLAEVDARCGGKAEGDSKLVKACDTARALLSTNPDQTALWKHNQ